MKIVIAGGTGFIGSYLNSKFLERGDEVKIVSRSANAIPWDTKVLSAELENQDLLINLAGRSINCRHTAKNKSQILDSRLQTTNLLSIAIDNCQNPPSLWINASASAIYKSSVKIQSTEDSTDLSADFLANVVLQWEKIFFKSRNIKTRKVAFRTSVVLGNDGGAFPALYNLTRFGLGGKVGTGKQKFSWIHLEDYFKSIIFIFENNTINGVVNCTSPNPVSNDELMSVMRKKVGIKLGLIAPEFAVKMAAMLIGTESDLILNSSNLYPKVLMDAGFMFKYASLKLAMDNLISNNK